MIVNSCLHTAIAISMVLYSLFLEKNPYFFKKSQLLCSADTLAIYLLGEVNCLYKPSTVSRGIPMLLRIMRNPA